MAAASISNLDPFLISEDCWAVAEDTAQDVVLKSVLPTLDSAEKRNDVIDYLHRLVTNSLASQVVAYGSVPLKTYLPDGDIDLTVLCSPNIDLACNVLAVLKAEEMNEDAEYEVKDTQLIDAEVKLVKCLVQNFVIDISFNQLGGLCTLCFLEQVDRYVGKNHLFKRSIILIKAWCYYESHILGAHHGLISTYALEILVLYIFHLFHSSLNGPLAVLYRFLDYFSKFDWENYCISLKGPVLKSFLPHIVVELPQKGKDDLMFGEEFLRNCIDVYSVPSRGLDTSSRSFSQKHLNIIDPLKENNNLGRSVHRGNFYRICSAFKYGAHNLGKILLLPRERIADEIKKFFTNTLERHGCKYGADIQSSALAFGAKWSSNLSSSSYYETLAGDEMQLKSFNGDFDDDTSGVEHKCTSVLRNELDIYLTRLNYSRIVSESVCSADGTALSGYCNTGDGNDGATSSSLSSKSANGTSDCSPRSSKFNSSLSRRCKDAPHFNFARSSTENEKFENGNFCQKWPADFVDEKMGFGSWLEHAEKHLVANHTVCANDHECPSPSSSVISSPDANSIESLSLDFREMELTDITGELETLDSLADLTGDLDSDIRSLLYGQSVHEYAFSPKPPTSPSQFRTKRALNTVRQTMPPKTSVYCASKSMSFNTSRSSEEKHMAQGTVACFSMKHCCSCKESFSQGKGRNCVTGPHGQGRKHNRSNVVARDNGVPPLPDTNSLKKSTHPMPPVQGHGKSVSARQSHQYNGGNTQVNGYSNLSFKIEFGSLGPIAVGSCQLASSTSRAWDHTPSLVAPEVQTYKPAQSKNQERFAERSYHLKKEDFPPLTV